MLSHVLGSPIGNDSIHVITAFPEQAKSVENALVQWVFEPYRRDGVPAEVETGLLFKFGETSK